jgi:hypothetical protein
MAWSDAARKAALEVRRRNAMITLHHGTTQQAAMKILREGFRPVRAGGRYEDDWYAGSPRRSNYASPSKTWASIFAARATKQKGGTGGGAIITIRVPERKAINEGGRGMFRYIRGVHRKRIVSVKLLPKSNLGRAEWS